MLHQRRRRSANVLQRLYKCFVFAGLSLDIPREMPFPLSTTYMTHFEIIFYIARELLIPKSKEQNCL